MYEFEALFISPRYHRSYLRGAGLPQPSEKDRDDWHNREHARIQRKSRVAEAAEKSGRR